MTTPPSDRPLFEYVDEAAAIGPIPLVVGPIRTGKSLLPFVHFTAPARVQPASGPSNGRA